MAINIGSKQCFVSVLGVLGVNSGYCYLGVHGVNSGLLLLRCSWGEQWLLLFRCSWGEQWLLLFRCSWGEQWLLLFRCSRVSYKSYFLWPMNMMFSASYSLFSLSSESPKLSSSVTGLSSKFQESLGLLSLQTLNLSRARPTAANACV